MSTLTFQLDEHKAEQLSEAARKRGVEIEELLRQIADDFLSRAQTAGTADFKTALAASVKENDELLRRLAQ
jgi:hypothetical protein